MKNLYLILFLFLSPWLIQSQTLKTSVFSSGGGSYTGTNYSGFGVFGQPLSGGTVGTNYQSKEGFIFAQQNILTVTIAANQNICYQTAASALTSEISGAEGEITCQWQFSVDADWHDIISATSTTCDPGILTETTQYRLKVNDPAGIGQVISNTVTVTVKNSFTSGAIETSGEFICYNGDPEVIGSIAAASGGDENISYKWQSSALGDFTDAVDIGSATGTTYDPPTGMTSTTTFRRLAKDGTCNPIFAASAGVWTVTVRENFTPGAINTTGETICYNGNPSLIGSVTAASGGDNTIQYQWQSVASFGDTPAWTDIPGATDATYDPPSGLTSSTDYRRTAKDGTCNITFTASTGTWTVTVDPATEAGAVTGGTSVCYGTNSTLLTLSGHTGDITKWQYSTDHINWSDLTSQTSTTYTAENLTEDTWFRAAVQSGVCPEAYSGDTQITVLSDFTISGYAKYDNNPKTPLNGLKITLKKDGNVLGTPVVTGSTGYYEFTDLEHGNYSLDISSAHPSGQWQTWGGVNNTDYLLVARHIAGTQFLPVNPPVVRTSASVKLPHPAINNTDAVAIRQAAKFPATGYSYFDTTKWVFSGIDASNALNNITVVCADVTRDIRGLCTGDVNGTYVPAAGYKTAEPGLELVNRGKLPITDEIIFPIRVNRDMEIGAITLFLDYDPAAIDITGVTMPVDMGTEPVFETREGLLYIGWMSPEPIRVKHEETLLLIHARQTDAFRSSQLTFCDSRLESEYLNAKPKTGNMKCEIRFTLNDNPLSEIADGEGNINDGLTLSIPDATGKPEWRNSEILIYPNPATSTLNVQLETFSLKPETLTLELVNMHGITVLKNQPETIVSGWNKYQMDVTGMAPGVYFLRTNVGGEILINKVLISR